jgi:hypothetical protein
VLCGLREKFSFFRIFKITMHRNEGMNEEKSRLEEYIGQNPNCFRGYIRLAQFLFRQEKFRDAMKSASLAQKIISRKKSIEEYSQNNNNPHKTNSNNIEKNRQDIEDEVVLKNLISDLEEILEVVRTVDAFSKCKEIGYFWCSHENVPKYPYSFLHMYFVLSQMVPLDISRYILMLSIENVVPLKLNYEIQENPEGSHRYYPSFNEGIIQYMNNERIRKETDQNISDVPHFKIITNNIADSYLVEDCTLFPERDECHIFQGFNEGYIQFTFVNCKCSLSGIAFLNECSEHYYYYPVDSDKIEKYSAEGSNDNENWEEICPVINFASPIDSSFSSPLGCYLARTNLYTHIRVNFFRKPNNYGGKIPKFDLYGDIV